MAIELRKGRLGRKLLSASVLQICNLILAAASSLFLMPLMVHHLGDRVYGLWSLAGAFISYYSLLDLGLSTAVGQYLSVALGRKDLNESRAVFNTALIIQSALGVLTLIVTAVLALSAHWFCKDPSDAILCSKLIAILGFGAALTFPGRVYRALLNAELRLDLQSVLDLLGICLRTGLMTWVVLAKGSLLDLAWVAVLATVPVLILQVWWGRREATYARIGFIAIDRSRTRQLFSYSMFSFGATIADIFRFQIDAIVVSAFVGVAAVTHYRIATVFSNYYINAIIAIASLFQPIMSRLQGAGDRANLEKVFFFASKISVVLSVFIGWVVMAWGRPFILRWMGSRYEDAYLPMLLLAISVFLDVCQGASVGFMYAIFKHRYYTYLNSAEGVINLVCSLALAPRMGIVGVALGTLIAAFAIRIVLQPIVVCKVSGLSLLRYSKFLVRNLLGSACIMSLAVVACRWAIRPTYAWLISSILLAAIIYGAATLLFVFDKSERGQLLLAITNRSHKQPEVESSPVLAVERT